MRVYVTNWSVLDALAISSSLFLIVLASVTVGTGPALWPGQGWHWTLPMLEPRSRSACHQLGPDDAIS